MTRCVKTLRRRHITLIELLVVLGVLSLVIGVIGFNIHELLIEQRFKNEVKMVVNQLRMAQNLMLIMNSDVRVRFREKKGAIAMEMESSKKLPWLKHVQGEPKELHTIRHVGFEEKNAIDIGNEKSGVGEIMFLSGGSVMSKGTLKLSTDRDNENALQRFICLSGHPEPIVISKGSKDGSCLRKDEEDFKDKLAKAIEQEIKEVGIVHEEVPLTP